jgi:hypothetical protein
METYDQRYSKQIKLNSSYPDKDEVTEENTA